VDGPPELAGSRRITRGFGVMPRPGLRSPVCWPAGGYRPAPGWWPGQVAVRGGRRRRRTPRAGWSPAAVAGGRGQRVAKGRSGPVRMNPHRSRVTWSPPLRAELRADEDEQCVRMDAAPRPGGGVGQDQGLELPAGRCDGLPAGATRPLLTISSRRRIAGAGKRIQARGTLRAPVKSY
jgi:hypothetical protein